MLKLLILLDYTIVYSPINPPSPRNKPNAKEAPVEKAKWQYCSVFLKPQGRFHFQSGKFEDR